MYVVWVWVCSAGNDYGDDGDPWTPRSPVVWDLKGRGCGGCDGCALTVLTRCGDQSAHGGCVLSGRAWNCHGGQSGCGASGFGDDLSKSRVSCGSIRLGDNRYTCIPRDVVR